MAKPPLLTVHTDGASRGNPGAAAFAFVISRDGAAPVEEAGCLGTLTNNQAEYSALVRALKRALELEPAAAVVVHSDSELMVKQMRGEYRVKNEELQPLYEEARDLARRLGGGVTFRHVRRALNARADALCNEALDGKGGPGARPSAAPAPAATEEGPSLGAQALACLRQAETAWRRGEATPTPETVWAQLVLVLEGCGVPLPATPTGPARSAGEGRKRNPPPRVGLRKRGVS
jgi:ribonuclease HI